MKRIAVFTGSRAEYGLLHATISRLSCHADLALTLLVGGSHLSPQHGNTVSEIEADGFPITARFPSPYVGQNTALDFAETSRLMAHFLDTTFERPDCLLVLGDRHEAFAAATAAVMSHVPVAHIHGGDLTGGGLLDDSVRHAISKLAHVHFPATRASQARLLAMGEEPWRTHVVGAPAVENVLWLERFSREHLATRFSLNPDKRWILFTQHPLSPLPEEAAAEISCSLSALVQLDNVEILVTASNQDAGGRAMLSVIRRYADRYPSVRFIESLGRVMYLNLLREAWLVAGNSSSGLLETACLGKPTLNIGDRQIGRERGNNVVDVEQASDSVFTMLRRFETDTAFYAQHTSMVHPFGEGDTSERIVDVLLNTDFSDTNLFSKQLIFPVAVS